MKTIFICLVLVLLVLISGCTVETVVEPEPEEESAAQPSEEPNKTTEMVDVTGAITKEIAR